VTSPVQDTDDSRVAAIKACRAAEATATETSYSGSIVPPVQDTDDERIAKIKLYKVLEAG
jgi:hypothetical protein